MFAGWPPFSAERERAFELLIDQHTQAPALLAALEQIAEHLEAIETIIAGNNQRGSIELACAQDQAEASAKLARAAIAAATKAR